MNQQRSVTISGKLINQQKIVFQKRISQCSKISWKDHGISFKRIFQCRKISWSPLVTVLPKDTFMFFWIFSNDFVGYKARNARHSLHYHESIKQSMITKNELY